MVPEKSCDIEDKFYTFYDPLYEIRIYDALSGRPMGRFAGDMDQILNKIFCEIIDSHEFSRLNFIKQTGLLWLVFPSATHTLFSHSLGNLVIGEYALKNIAIKKNGRIVGNLGDWLKELKLKDEFFLALLLNDIGKPSFSFLLRNNKHFSKYNPGEMAVRLIRGDGVTYEFFEDDHDRTIHDVLEEVGDVDIDILCYLINHETSKKFDNHEDIEILYDIVSGKLNLDRLDHYRRDSYFIGTKFATFNIRSLLRNVYIDKEEHSLNFNNEGIKYAYQLLTNKEMLLCEAFENQTSLSYDAMMDFCISKYFESEGDVARKEFLSSSDEKILWDMLKKSSISKLVKRIINRDPYLSTPIKIGTDVAFEKLENFKSECVNRFGWEEEDILLYPPMHQWNEHSQWLNLRCGNGNRLFDLESYNELIGYINRKQDERRKQIYFFLPDRSKLHLLENELKNTGIFE
jgi:HD superfamily phosphohydrolase